jgi:3-hydroxy-3-methylglutaryl CoA synthase
MVHVEVAHDRAALALTDRVLAVLTSRVITHERRFAEHRRDAVTLALNEAARLPGRKRVATASAQS